MGFRKKRSTSPQEEHGASGSTPKSVIHKKTDWVSDAFRIAELASAAGGLLPFPYLKGAADLVMTLLKPIQQMQQNQDIYKDLTNAVTTTLKILHEETKKNSETASSLNHFEEDCKTFYQYLKEISDDLKSFNKPYKLKLLRGYFTADREKDSLLRYQNRIATFRSDLVFRGIIRLQVCSDADEMESHFEKVRLGDLNVLKSTSNEQVEHWEVRWKKESQTRIVRVYKGQDAISRFNAEKEWYSRYRHPGLMQLFGIITSKENPGLVFQNSLFMSPQEIQVETYYCTIAWCIPINQFNPRFGDPLGYIDTYQATLSFSEGLQYVAENISPHAILSWRDLGIHRPFIGFNSRNDRYLGSCYVNLLDGHGLVVFEWLQNVSKGVPAFQPIIPVSNKSPQEVIKILERIDMLQVPPKSNVPSNPSLLWDLYDAICVLKRKDVPAPAYPVYAGVILLVDEPNGAPDASNAALLGLIPCREPLFWIPRDVILEVFFKKKNRSFVECCGEHFRTRVPVDIDISTTDDLQTVVVECDLQYSNDAAWKQLIRAYVSQSGYLHARTGGVHDSGILRCYWILMAHPDSFQVQMFGWNF